MSQNRENSPCLSRRKTGFQLGKDSLPFKVKMRRFPSVRKGRGQKGTRLLLYSFCLFVIKDPTLLHSRRELGYLTLSPAKWPPNATCLEWSLALSQQQTQEWHQSQLLPSVLPELARQSLGSQTSQKHLNSTPGFATMWPWESYLTIEASGELDNNRFHNLRDNGGD